MDTQFVDQIWRMLFGVYSFNYGEKNKLESEWRCNKIRVATFILMGSPYYDGSESICKPIGEDLLFVDRPDHLSLRLPKTHVKKGFSDINEDKSFSNFFMKLSNSSEVCEE